MNITVEILFYLYSKNYPVLDFRTPVTGQKLLSVKKWYPNESPEDDALYVLTPDELSGLCSMPEMPVKNLIVASPDGAGPTDEELRKLKGLNYAFTSAFRTTYELQNKLLQIFHELLQEENELLLATLDPSRSEEVFEFASKWFPWEYSIVDIDMRLIYRSRNLHMITGSGNVNRIPAESIRELILSREFHEAAKKKDVFYESMSFNSATAFARNILPDDQYAGRVVMFLPDPIKTAPPGAEELFRFYTDCVMESLRRTGKLSTRHINAPLRTLCSSLFSGLHVPERSILEVLGREGWDIHHLYSVIIFRFLPNTAWDAQLETTLPYLADELENNWPYSCAVNTGSEINLVIDLTLSNADISHHGFHQQFASFVRDHVCLAGVSSVFQQFSLLPEARKCADAALELGQKKDPHFWYYLFDDYRLDFLKETLENSLAPDFLYHPALRILMKYDAEKKTDYTGTLRAYLENDHNMTIAADAVFVHRTTFFRRMEHIRRLTGIDLNDPETILLLELSFQFLNTGIPKNEL